MSSSGEEKGGEALMRKPSPIEKPLTDGSEVKGSIAVGVIREAEPKEPDPVL